MGTIEISADEYKNLINDSVRLNMVQKYILGELKDSNSTFVDSRQLVLFSGITEEVEEMKNVK